MNVLIGCEESQAVCKEFRRLGHEAYSCDLLPCSGGHPEWHLQMDVFEAIALKDWNLTITFQPCTDIAVSGARHFWYKREDGRQEKAIRFFFEVWKVSHCSENPIGIMNGGKYIKKWFPDLHTEMKKAGFPFRPAQIVQPWQFGHGETKATCLWLNGLPPLKNTQVVEGREPRIWKMPPSREREREAYSGRKHTEDWLARWQTNGLIISG